MLRIAERGVVGDDGATVVVVTPHGDLDLASLADLHAALGRAINTAGAPGGRPRVVLDLAAADVMHPVVLGVLLDARRRCRNAGGALALVVNAPEVSATLADADVVSLFDVFPGLQEAVGHVGAFVS